MLFFLSAQPRPALPRALGCFQPATVPCGARAEPSPKRGGGEKCAGLTLPEDLPQAAHLACWESAGLPLPASPTDLQDSPAHLHRAPPRHMTRGKAPSQRAKGLVGFLRRRRAPSRSRQNPSRAGQERRKTGSFSSHGFEIMTALSGFLAFCRSPAFLFGFFH